MAKWNKHEKSNREEFYEKRIKKLETRVEQKERDLNIKQQRTGKQYILGLITNEEE